MTVKGAIFDLDGTLLDSMAIWDTIGADYLVSRGIQPEPGLNGIFRKMSMQQAADYYRQHYGITGRVDTIIRGVNALLARFYTEEVTVKPGVVPLLNKLAQSGVRMCVATANDRGMAEAALKRNGIDHFFGSIVTCSEVGAGKDQPVFFKKALAILGTRKEETLVFEDALYAIISAKRAGFTVAAIYDKASEGEAEQIKQTADFYINSFDKWNFEQLSY